MIDLIKSWFKEAQFWIGIIIIIFFFGMAMSSKYDESRALKSLEKARKSLAVHKIENVTLKAALDMQNHSIAALSDKTNSTLAKLVKALDKAKEFQVVQKEAISDIRNLPVTNDCEIVRQRMITDALK